MKPHTDVTGGRLGPKRHRRRGATLEHHDFEWRSLPEEGAVIAHAARGAHKAPIGSPVRAALGIGSAAGALIGYSGLGASLAPGVRWVTSPVYLAIIFGVVLAVLVGYWQSGKNRHRLPR